MLRFTVSVAPFIRTADALRASFEEHRLRRSATASPKILSQKGWMRVRIRLMISPNQRRTPRKRPPLLGLFGPAIRLQCASIWERFKIFRSLSRSVH